MRHLLITSIFMVFLSCDHVNNGNNGNNGNSTKYAQQIMNSNTKSNNSASFRALNDSIIKFEPIDHISVNWDLKKCHFVIDSNYFSSKLFFLSHKDALIIHIADSILTPISCCEERLTKGAATYLLIDRFIGLPYFAVLHMQFDCYDLKCQYPEGLLSYVNSHLTEVKRNVDKYLNENYIN